MSKPNKKNKRKHLSNQFQQVLTGETSGIHTWRWKNGNVGCHISQQSQTGGRQGPMLSSNRGDRRSQVKLDKQRSVFLTWLWDWGRLGSFSKDLCFLYHKGIYKLLQMRGIIAKRVDCTLRLRKSWLGDLRALTPMQVYVAHSVCQCVCVCVRACVCVCVRWGLEKCQCARSVRLDIRAVNPAEQQKNDVFAESEH